MPLCVSRAGTESLAAVGLLQIQGERQAIPKERLLSESNRASQTDDCVPALKMESKMISVTDKIPPGFSVAKSSPRAASRLGISPKTVTNKARSARPTAS